MSFYPDVKAHLSPSAMDTWHNQRSAFIKSYFQGEHMHETAAMAGGTKIHRLIEAGLIKATHCYDSNEEEVKIPVKDGIVFFGKPDSFTGEATKGKASFVDYKTGKKNEWKEKLPSNIKMRSTAWLVWKATELPKVVEGHIEYIATEWNPVSREVVPIEDKTTEIVTQTYHAEDLEKFTDTIEKTIDEVNEAYEKWLESTDEFMSKDDMEKYAELKGKKEVIESELKEIADRLMAQMEFGGKSTVPSPLGTFYITERKTYDYPIGLAFKVGKKLYNLAEADEVEAAAKAAKKNYELATDPKSVSKSLGFRAPKEK